MCVHAHTYVFGGMVRVYVPTKALSSSGGLVVIINIIRARNYYGIIRLVVIVTYLGLEVIMT